MVPIITKTDVRCRQANDNKQAKPTSNEIEKGLAFEIYTNLIRLIYCDDDLDQKLPKHSPSAVTLPVLVPLKLQYQNLQ